MAEETKQYIKKQGFSLLPTLTITTPVVIMFFVFLSKLDTRVTVIEQTAVTQKALETTLRTVLKDELKPVLQGHETRIRCLEIEVGKGKP